MWPRDQAPSLIDYLHASFAGLVGKNHRITCPQPAEIGKDKKKEESRLTGAPSCGERAGFI
jgi:hypothetical protein